MIVYLKDEICLELLDKLIGALNKLPKDDTLKIYINTLGGYVDIQDAILDIIDKNKDRVELIGSGFISSAGFNIFFKATCKKSLVYDTIGMAHFIWTSVDIDQTGKGKTAFDKFEMKEMKKSKKEYIDFFKELGFTPSELNDLKKGNEHYFTHERLLDLLKNQNGKENQERSDSIGVGEVRIEN